MPAYYIKRDGVRTLRLKVETAVSLFKPKNNFEIFFLCLLEFRKLLFNLVSETEENVVLDIKTAFGAVLTLFGQTANRTENG